MCFILNYGYRHPMAKPHIVFLDTATVDLGDLELTSLRKQGVLTTYPLTAAPDIVARAASAEVIITNKCVLTDVHFAALPQLKLICVAATGTNNIDITAASKRGIAVANVAGYSTQSVAEHTLLFLLAASHRLLDHDRSAKEEAWSRSTSFAVLDFPYRELHGKTLGIVGYGTIGKQVAKLAKAFGMTVLLAKLPDRKYAATPARYSLKHVLSKSDYITLHCALTDRTHHLINSETLSWMKPHAVVLNLARGAVVDEPATAAALRAGKFGLYASDVLSQEPPAQDHPLLSASLRNRVMLTPHIAWASLEARQRLVDDIAHNIAAFRHGKRRNRVDLIQTAPTRRSCKISTTTIMDKIAHK